MNWIPLISAIVGGVIAIGGNLTIEWFRHRRRAKSLALALRGEINAIIEVVEIRRYAELLSEGIGIVVATKKHQLWHLPAKSRYFIIYEENASDLGILSSDVTEHIARTYALAKSFLDDVTNPNWLSNKGPDEVVHALEEAKQVLLLAIESGQRAISEIEATYMGPPWWRRMWIRLEKGLQTIRQRSSW
ncbi:hypothetical protein ABRZ10_05450 [Castellaniella ginsengisoli]|uniref:DUF4230 domain-containing protein n=1 Tax=Castellaniella ginsengisoli TaxID=546114 RepID=A0AB39DV16_9BURK